MSIRLLSLIQHPDRPTTETFIGFHRAGIDITVSCPPEHPNHALLVSAGVPTIDLRLNGTIDPRGIRALRALVQGGRYDIVHTYYNDAISNAALAVLGLPVKLVAYRGIVGAVGFLDPVSWLRYLNPRIDRIICVCDAIRRHFLGMRPKFLRMPEERPVTVHKGHKLEWYTATPADLAEFGIPAGGFVVGCISNYRPRKGIEYLVRAMDLLPPDVPVHLLLVGRMSGRALDRAIARSRARDRIHRPGYRKDAPAISAACDVFCLPSVKREGLPRSVIEAMAYRVPPIVTNSGGSPELVVDGSSGLVVPVRDPGALAAAIERLYRDAELRRRLGEGARDRIARDFRNEDTVRKIIDVYRSLVPEKAGSIA
ncbi:MAG: glycosyltransferase family 4 protein [Gammaproteobacteria bacterium]|nr:glycosyltransferase family 4 protein [Gammaproteobacteria bacterium]MDH4255179.1 glycosyltransferase family 4 protein [Gammaproteobacteria bacterium]MDH5310062.1 glycosyltransferase family 4 protein [Gammaproteobacteria bacterium]